MLSRKSSPRLSMPDDWKYLGGTNHNHWWNLRQDSRLLIPMSSLITLQLQLAKGKAFQNQYCKRCRRTSSLHRQEGRTKMSENCGSVGLIKQNRNKNFVITKWTSYSVFVKLPVILFVVIVNQCNCNANEIVADVQMSFRVEIRKIIELLIVDGNYPVFHCSVIKIE